MNTIKGIYHDGVVELLDKPRVKKPMEVLVVFPEKQKKVRKIAGLFKNQAIDYDSIKKELKNSSSISARHIIEESEQ